MPAGKLAVWQQLPDSDPQKNVCKEYAEKYNAKFKMPESSFGGYAYDAIRMLKKPWPRPAAIGKKSGGELEGLKNFVGVSGIFNMSPEDHNGLSPGRLCDGNILEKRQL